MKILVDVLENGIDVSEDYVRTVNICPNKLYARVLTEFAYCTDEETKITVIESDTVLNNNIIVFIDSLFSYDFDSKDIQNRIRNIIISNLNDDVAAKQNIEELFYDFTRKFIQGAGVFDYSLSYEYGFDVKKIIKLLNISVDREEARTPYDIALKIIDVYSELFDKKLIVFNGIKAYFSKEEFDKFCLYAIYKKLRVLSIEHGDCECKGKNERAIIVDDDYDWIAID